MAEKSQRIPAQQKVNSHLNGAESVETLSSDGPRRICFHPDGRAITPGNFSSTGVLLLTELRDAVLGLQRPAAAYPPPRATRSVAGGP